MIDIHPTDDFPTLRRLGVDAGLEPGGRIDGERLGLWGAWDANRMVGGVAFERLDGLPTITWLWVAETHRRSGTGSRLLATLECEARLRGIDTVWAAARTPAVFLRSGYRPVPPGPERDTLLAGCSGCAQRGSTCSPEAVVKRTGRRRDVDPGPPGRSSAAHTLPARRSAGCGEGSNRSGVARESRPARPLQHWRRHEGP